MKTKIFLLVALSLMTIFFVGCKKDKNKATSTTELAGTKWAGTISPIDVELSFDGNVCNIRANSGGTTIGTASGTYSCANSIVKITITSISGDFGGMLNKGDVLSGTYNLSLKTLVFPIMVMGNLESITFWQQ